MPPARTDIDHPATIAAAALVALIIAAGIGYLLLQQPGLPPPQSPPASWPQVTRTMLTTRAGDSFMTTDVVMPEDLDRGTIAP